MIRRLRARLTGHLARGVVLASGVVAASGCETAECVVTDDCSIGFDCTLDGVCVSQPQGEIRWVSPEPGSVVPARFDAVVEVSFRAPAAQIFIDRDVVEQGDACAPFVPAQAQLIGDLQDALVQQVTLPGLFALGESFGVSATLNAAGGTRSVRVDFRGAPTGYGGARLEVADDASNIVDASSSLGLTVDATLDRAAVRALVSVEPLGGQPTPRQLVGPPSSGGVVSLEGVRAPIARGPQVLWLDTEDETGAHRCGLGVAGRGDAFTGVELGLMFDGAEPGQLDLLVRLADEATTCSFTDPGDACEAVYETRAPTRAGEEVLLVKATGGVLTVAVVPGAAGPSMTARVRVSSNGVHVGWLGPFPLQPALGESWIAGSIVLDGSLARLVPLDEVGYGIPF